MCGGKGHAGKICAKVVSVFACQAPDDETLGGEKETFFCDAPSKLSDAREPIRDGQIVGDALG